MARLVYLDETGSVGKGARSQPLLTVVAVIVDEEQVQPLSAEFRQLARRFALDSDAEFHGNEVWGGTKGWNGRPPELLIEAYEAVIALLDTLAIGVAYASIDKAMLHARYDGRADGNAYRLAVQFLLERIDQRTAGSYKILIADEHAEQELSTIKMVADMQTWGGGEVPGTRLNTFIDSMHFVSSHASPGVQLADMVAYALQRQWNARDRHPNAAAAIHRIVHVIERHRLTWREPWPNHL